MRAILLVGLLVLGGCGPGKSGDVTCYPENSNGWTFHCGVTGKGDETAADGAFSSQYITRIREQGNDLSRSFRGARWHAIVVVEQPNNNGKVKAGQRYKMYGTVDEIDGGRIRFTDCLFVEVPKN